MGVQFTLRESSALYALLAEHKTDIILKTDRQGYIEHASPGIERLGYRSPDMLIGPHIVDLVHPAHAAAVWAEHEAVIGGLREGAWLEITAVAASGRERWYALQMRSLADDHGRIYGAICLMRCREERRVFEDRLFAAEMSDPLTGLTNRRAFIAMLRHLVDERIDASLAILGIDHFRAMNMRHGQSFGDEVVAAVAELVQTVVRRQDIVSRIGGGSLGVLLPGATAEQAAGICRRVVDTLAELGRASRSDSFAITASAGVTAVGGTLDKTLKRAEMALFMARAKGCSRLELATSPDGGPLLA
ncbi:MAG: GGDEF domain-containing protein [Sphingomonadales bacterium]|nr:GGDEF domain-containing protein [Sphingomonadales bacterium]